MKVALFSYEEVDGVPVLRLRVKRWWMWHTERWTRRTDVEHEHRNKYGQRAFAHGHWVRADGEQSDCEFAQRLDGIVHSAKHAPAGSMPDNVVELHKRGMYR